MIALLRTPEGSMTLPVLILVIPVIVCNLIRVTNNYLNPIRSRLNDTARKVREMRSVFLLKTAGRDIERETEKEKQLLYIKLYT